MNRTMLQELNKLKEDVLNAVKAEAVKSVSEVDPVEEDRKAEKKACENLEEVIMKEIKRVSSCGGHIATFELDESSDFDEKKLHASRWSLMESLNLWRSKTCKYLKETRFFDAKVVESVTFSNKLGVQSHYRLVVSW